MFSARTDLLSCSFFISTAQSLLAFCAAALPLSLLVPVLMLDFTLSGPRLNETCSFGVIIGFSPAPIDWQSLSIGLPFSAVS